MSRPFFAILRQWLFEYLVDKDCINDFERIYYAVDNFQEEKKDYIVLSFNSLNNLTLGASVEMDDTDRTITEDKSFTLTIQYVGMEAFFKLSEIMDRIRIDDNAHNFLKQKNMRVIPINIVNVSDLIGDNIIESAVMECKVYYSTQSFDKNIDSDIELVDLSSIILN